MLNDDELWEKCLSDGSITGDDLGIHPNVYGSCMSLECGSKTFYTDGKDYYDKYGNKVNYKNIKEMK